MQDHKSYGNQNRPYSSNRPASQGFQDKKLDEEIYLEDAKNHFGKHYESILKSDKPDYNDYLEKLKSYVASMRETSNSQIRNIFSALKRPDLTVLDIYKLRPKLAYAYGRADKKSPLRKLLILLDDQFSKVKTETEAKELVSFLEAIIAYHKFYGGK